MVYKLTVEQAREIILRQAAGGTGDKNAPGGEPKETPAIQSERSSQPEQIAQQTIPTPTIQGTVQSMPNSDKLTPFESWIYERLPGFSQSTVGKALADFGESWVGKALNVVDFAAEGLERTAGFAAQYLEVADKGTLDEFNDNLGAAWNAGSLTYDVTNLPTLARDKDGNITGMQIPTDLPGMAGLVEARKKLAAGTPLEQVKAEYYQDLGALALRAQLYDTYGHVVFDPLNYILPALKPIERLQASRAFLVANKGEKLADAIKLAEQAGNVEEAARLSEMVSKGMEINRTDKFVLALTGGDPFKATAKSFERQWWNPLALTPSARAHEYLTMVTDHVGQYIIANIDEPKDIVNALDKALAGSLGTKYGHAFLTLEGRTAQAALSGFDIKARDLLTALETTADERRVLSDIATALKTTPTDVLERIARDEVSVIAKQLGGTMAPEDLTKLGKTLIKSYGNGAMDTVPLDNQMFKLMLNNELADHAAKQAILQFGVKSEGLITKMSNTVKAAETLAFLKINPAYALRNGVNNELTMLARGMFNHMGIDDITKFWDDVGFTPMRMSSGFGAAGLGIAEQGEVGGKAIYKALQGDRDFWNKSKDFLSNIKLGKFDMGEASARMERMASARAFTGSYMQGMKDYFWKPGKAYDHVADFVKPSTRQWMEGNDPELIRTVENVIRSSQGNEKALDAFLKGENLNFNISSVLDDASAKAGFDLHEVLEPELIHKMQQGLDDAMKGGTDEVMKYISGIRDDLEKHLDDLNEVAIGRIADEVEAQITAEGPLGYTKVWADEVGKFWQAHSDHAIRMSQLEDRLLGVSDQKTLNVLWRKISNDNSKFFGRTYDRFDAVLQGMRKGAKQAGFDVNPQVIDSFKGLKKSWRDFYSWKEKTYEAFFDARLQGKKPPKDWDVITAEVRARYDKAIALEDTATRQMNNIVSQAIPDDTIRAYFVSARNNIADVMKEDKALTVEFWDSLKGMLPKQKQAAFKEFWMERNERWGQIAKMEEVTAAALEGDPQGIGFLDNILPGAAKKVAGEAEEVIQKPATTAADKARGMTKELQGDILESPLRKNMLEAEGKPIAERIDLYASTPGTELPPNVNKRLVELAQKRLDDIVTKGGSKEEISTLEKIVTGKGLDTGSDVFKVKKEILDEMSKAPDADDVFGIGQKAGQEVGQIAPRAERQFIANSDKLLPKTYPVAEATDSWFARDGFGALDAIEDAAIRRTSMPPTILDDLPVDVKDDVLKYIEHTKGQMSDARYAATRYAEIRRDAALLNYNRRYNFDTWSSTIFPYAFWPTHSMTMWALHSIDHPAMLSTYLRYKKTMATMGAPGQQLPERLKNSIRIKLPFAPDWMGSGFIDPMKMALPFDSFSTAYERWRTNQYTLDGRAERVLQQWSEDGMMDEELIQQALQTKEGDIWDRAIATAKDNDENLRTDAFDYVSLFTSPHAPIQWASEIAKGTPENIQPFSPLSRMSRGISTMLGIQDFPLLPHNLEGKVRKSLGLPFYDKWDEYRVDRMLANMAATGDYSTNDILRAMIDRKGAIFEEAADKANKEFAVGALGSMLGIPTKAYPTGELLQRTLNKQFSEAYSKYENGDIDALNNFFDAHPEYEARLALYDDPEVRMRDFMVDELWNTYNNMPTVNKKEVREQLGDFFDAAFINKETRSYDSIPLETMQIWIKLMGGNPVGTLKTPSEKTLKLTPPETAWRLQVFYDTRDMTFPDFYKQQKEYFAMKEGSQGRRDYLKLYPELKRYWNWRNDFMMRNPDAVVYLTDTPEDYQPSSLEEMESAQDNQPNYTWNEWKTQLGGSLSNIVLDNVLGGEELSDTAENQLEYIADRMGISVERLIALMAQSIQH